MKKNKLDNIFFKKKEIIKHTRGNLLKLFKKKKNENIFFKEVYCTWIKKNKIKGWKKHTKMTMNIKVIMGKVKFILSKDMKSFKKIIISENDKFLLTISKNIFFAFQGLDKKNEILNFSNIKHSKKECINLPLNRINYKWN